MKPLKLDDDDWWWVYIYDSKDVVWKITETERWMTMGDFRQDNIKWAITRDK